MAAQVPSARSLATASWKAVTVAGEGVAGEGVAVGDMLTARHVLDAARLIAPFEVCMRSLRSPPEQYFLHHGGRRAPERVQRFGK